MTCLLSLRFLCMIGVLFLSANVLHFGAKAQTGLPSYLETAQLKADCQNGDARACRELYPLTPKSIAAYRDAVQSCNRGSAEGCFRTGGSYAHGYGVEMSIAKARAYYQRACDGNYAAGCNNYGRMLYAGEGGPKDEKSAVTILEKGCKLGNKNSCRAAENSDEIKVYRLARSRSESSWPEAYRRCVAKEREVVISAAEHCRQNLKCGDMGVCNPMDTYACFGKKGTVKTGRIRPFSRGISKTCYQYW